MGLLTALLVCYLPNLEIAPVTECDVIEFNAISRDHGETIGFTQWILWDGNGQRDVVFWQRENSTDSLIRRHDGWELLLWDEGRLYPIRAPVLKRSLTDFDPEFIDRKELPTSYRRGLSRPVPMIPFIERGSSE